MKKLWPNLSEFSVLGSQPCTRAAADAWATDRLSQPLTDLHGRTSLPPRHGSRSPFSLVLSCSLGTPIVLRRYSLSNVALFWLVAFVNFFRLIEFYAEQTLLCSWPMLSQADVRSHSPRVCSTTEQEWWASCSRESQQPSPIMFVDLQRQEDQLEPLTIANASHAKQDFFLNF